MSPAAPPRPVDTAVDPAVEAGPEPTGGLRARKKYRTRQDLRRAALALVAERGLDAVTTDEIAAAAGVSPRTFFNYFTSKEECLVGNDPALAESLAGELVARPADESPLEALRAVFLDYTAGATMDHEMWRQRLAVIDANPSLLPALHGSSAGMERRLTQAVAERLGTDPVSDPYPALVVSAASVATRTAMQHCGACGFTRPLPEVIDELFDSLAQGLPVPVSPARPATPRSARSAQP